MLRRRGLLVSVRPQYDMHRLSRLDRHHTPSVRCTEASRQKYEGGNAKKDHHPRLAVSSQTMIHQAEITLHPTRSALRSACENLLWGQWPNAALAPTRPCLAHELRSSSSLCPPRLLPAQEKNPPTHFRLVAFKQRSSARGQCQCVNVAAAVYQQVH